MLELFKKRFDTMIDWATEAAGFAEDLDWLGDAESHPEGSEERELAALRDAVDLLLARKLVMLGGTLQWRAQTTRSLDLLVDAFVERKGDGDDALRLMRRYHALFGDETERGEPSSETLPDLFAWETYLRVSALPELVEKFPDHLKHGARGMHGWPMIVSHHLDCTPEFKRIAERLELGAGYPLNVGPRKKRGAETPLLRYLEPLIWSLHIFHSLILQSEKWRDDDESLTQAVEHCWWGPPGAIRAAEIAILKLAPSLPRLSKKSAREWSRKVIVPLIMLEDAGTPKTCEIRVLRNIWKHRSVKSRATFQSRLHSAVTDALQRFGRPG